MKTLKNTISALAVSALALGAVSVSAFVMTADVAYAKGGNGNGGGNGNSGGNSKNAGNGNSKSAANGNGGGNGNGGNGGRGNGNGLVKDGKFLGIFKVRNNRDSQPNVRKPAKVRTASVQTQSTSVETSLRPKPRNGRGALASELKGLNAAHASPNALANASPNSMVGRVAAYQTAVLNEAERELLEEDLLTLQEQLDGLTTDPRDPEAIQAEIDALDPESETYADDLAALQGELEASENAPQEPDRNAADIQSEIDALDPESETYGDDLAALQSELDNANAWESGQAEIAAIEEEIMTKEEELAALGLTPEEALDAATGGRELSPEALAELHRLLDLDPPTEDEPEAELPVEEELAEAAE